MTRPKRIDENAKNGRPCIEDPEALPDWTLSPIGVVHSPFKEHFGTPRQPGTNDPDLQPHAPDAFDATIYLKKGLQNLVKDLNGFDRIWISFVFNYSRGAPHQVTPPRDNEKRGVLATRSPHRPNPLGLSCVRLLNVQGCKLLIRDHDLLHGTPILDIKPYIPYCDSWPDAKAGWVDQLSEHAPDHRWD